MYPTFAPQLADILTVDDAEFKAKFVAHLLLPLNLQGRWADNQHGADTMTQLPWLELPDQSGELIEVASGKPVPVAPTYCPRADQTRAP